MSANRADETIYVKLVDEGTDVWRPVPASLVRPLVYRISATEVPDEETWEFNPGDIVRCREHQFQDGSVGAVAIERLPRDA